MLQILSQHQPLVNTTVQESLPATFKSIFKKIENQCCLTKNASKSNEQVAIKSQITNGMRLKLLSWLEKLTNTTFQFQKSTFLIAAIILDQHLAKKDQSPKDLQMVGCACLFIASKLNQSAIVAPECYIKASCSIFSKKQLLQQQLQIYSGISWKKIKSGPHNIIKSGLVKLHLQEKHEMAQEWLCFLIKQQNIDFKDHINLAQLALTIVCLQKTTLLEKEDVLRLIRSL